MAETFCRVMSPAEQGLEHVGQLGLGSMVLAGGFAGVCYWLPVYPADIVKSRIQVDDFQSPTYRGTADCVKQVCTEPCLACLGAAIQHACQQRLSCAGTHTDHTRCQYVRCCLKHPGIYTDRELAMVFI